MGILCEAIVLLQVLVLQLVDAFAAFLPDFDTFFRGLGFEITNALQRFGC